MVIAEIWLICLPRLLYRFTVFWDFLGYSRWRTIIAAFALVINVYQGCRSVNPYARFPGDDIY